MACKFSAQWFDVNLQKTGDRMVAEEDAITYNPHCPEATPHCPLLKAESAESPRDLENISLCMTKKKC